MMHETAATAGISERKKNTRLKNVIMQLCVIEEQDKSSITEVNSVILQILITDAGNEGSFV